MTTVTVGRAQIEQWLEALEICEKDGYIPVRLTRESITAIKEALAQPEQEQEPVAWINIKRDMTYLHGPYNADDLPLYTKPPQRKPLTATQIKKAMMDAKLHFCGEVDVLLTRAIEAAHGIKENNHE